MVKPVYLDCNATAPLDPRVRAEVVRWTCDEVGNAGSRTHDYGARAKRAVTRARESTASVVDATPDGVLFTSGATESNNLAILGLEHYGVASNRRHVVTTAIEHKSVLEPVAELARRGFDVEEVRPDASGAVSAETVRQALRDDTLLVSVMQVNNETGVRQPVNAIARALEGHEAYFHVDAAQGFGKDLDPLRTNRIDLISISSHKVYGPMGVGALIRRRRGFSYPPLSPLAFGGGQERGLRPGTLPTALIAGFGEAARTALQEVERRTAICGEIRRKALAALKPLKIHLHGNPSQCQAHVLNFSVDAVNSEAIMIAVKDLVAVSNGSACTSQSYQPSHVLRAMGLPQEEILGAVRLSWCHMTPEVDWDAIANRISSLR